MTINSLPNQDEAYDIDGESFIGKGGRYELSDGAVKTFMHVGRNVTNEETHQFGIAEKTVTLDTNFVNVLKNSNPHLTIYSNGARMNLSGSSCPHRSGSITYGSGGSEAGDLKVWGNLSIGLPLTTHSGNYMMGRNTPLNATINIDAIGAGRVIVSYQVDFTSDNASIMHNLGMALVMADIKTITKLGIHVDGGRVGTLPMFFRWQ